MFQLRNVLTLAASLCLMGGLAACDADDDDDDGGAVDEGASYNVLVIQDASEVENQKGTPGADIYSVMVECDGDAVNYTDGKIELGDGKVCTGENLNDKTLCSSGIDRAKLDSIKDESKDTYASIGMGGVITLTYADSLVGCDIVIGEVEGNDEESYKVYVCEEGVTSNFAASTKCINAPANPYTGEASFTVDDADAE